MLAKELLNSNTALLLKEAQTSISQSIQSKQKAVEEHIKTLYDNRLNAVVGLKKSTIASLERDRKAWKNNFETETQQLLSEVERALKAKYPESQSYLWGWSRPAGYDLELRQAQDKIRNERRGLFEQQNPPLEVKYQSDIQAAQDKESRDLNELNQINAAITRKTQDEFVRIKAKYDDAFLLSHISQGLNAISAAVPRFYTEHSELSNDPELIRACFRVSREATPWSNWRHAVLNVMNGFRYKTFCAERLTYMNDMPDWVNKTMPFSEVMDQFEADCKRYIPVVTLEPAIVDPYMRCFLYAPTQLKTLYAEAMRAGIYSFSWSDRGQPELKFRRMDWLRSIYNLLPWSRFDKTMHQSSVLSNVLALTLDELDKYIDSVSNQVIIVNVSTEETPLWVVLKGDNTNGWMAYVPEAKDPFVAINQQVKDQLQAKGLNKLSFVAVDISKNFDNESQDVAVDLLWNSIIGGRIVPYCMNPMSTSVDISQFRASIPFPLLLESTLACAQRASSISTSQGDLCRNYGLRPLSKTFVSAVDVFSEFSTPLVKACFDYYRATPSFINQQQFLAAFDENAFALRHEHELSPSTLKINLKKVRSLSHSYNQRDLSKYDLFYFMLLVHQYRMHTIEINSPLFNDYSFYDCSTDFTLNSQGLLPERKSTSFTSIINSNASITTVTKPSPLLPPALIYLAECAARNRLMKPYFSKEAIASEYANVDLWKETEKEVFRLLEVVSVMPEAQLEHFIAELCQFTGASGTPGWLKEGCIDKPVTEQQKMFWEFAQIAQMGACGIDLIIKHWNKGQSFFPALTFDLNCQTLKPAAYLNCLRSYANQYKTNPLPRLNLVMPLEGIHEKEFVIAMAELLDLMDTQSAFAKDKAIYLYNFESQTVHARISCLEQLLILVKNKSIKTLIHIPSYDISATAKNSDECKAHDLYRQIQNAAYNNRRLLTVDAVKKNTASLRTYLVKAPLPIVTPLLDVQEVLAVTPSHEESEYVLAHSANGIQQQLQQEQQQQRQVAQQRQVEVAQKVEVEQEVQIAVYRGSGQDLWTRDSIETKGKALWDQIPESSKVYSGYNATHDTPLTDLFDSWVGSNQPAKFVVKYIEPSACEKIMQHASYFRFGLYYDNLPPGFFLAWKNTDDLVLCFDKTKEQEELFTLAQGAQYGTLTPRQMRKMILLTPEKPQLFHGDDRQFELLPSGADSSKIKPSYWRQLATREHRPEYLEAAQKVWPINANNPMTLDAKVQSALQLSNYGSKSNPQVSKQQETVMMLQRWISTFSASNPNLAQALFIQKRDGTAHEKGDARSHLKAFGQIALAYDAQPLSNEHYGSRLFMQLAGQIQEHYASKPEYFFIWRDRLLSTSENWTERLTKAEVDATIQSLRVLKDKPTHTAFWWALVDAHGATVGPLQYAPLWNSAYQFFQYLDEQGLVLSPLVFSQWQQLMQQPGINGQVLLERMVSVMKKISSQAVNRADSIQYQQHLLNHLNDIDWHHDGLFYANRFEGINGFWDEAFLAQQFKYHSSKLPSYTPSFDQFTIVADETKQSAQEQAAIVRFLGRLYANDGLHYKQVSQFFSSVWTKNEALAKLKPAERIDLLRLLLKSYVLGQDRLQTQPQETLNKLIQLISSAGKATVLKKISYLLSIDSIAKRDLIWPLHFHYLPDVVQALSSPEFELYLAKLTPKSADGLALIKQIELAMNCFNSSPMQEQAEQFGVTTAELLHYWLKQKESKPYLKTFPWLSLSLMKSPAALATAEVALTNLVTQGGREYTHLSTQLQSIDYSRTTYLPDTNEIIAGLPLTSSWLGNKSLDADKRKTFVAEITQKGCHVIDQGLGFRTLNDGEKEWAFNEFQRRLNSSSYFSLNIELFKGFLQQAAVPEGSVEANQRLISDLIDTLFALHNKVYYNELGQILGTINDAVAKKSLHPNHYYSLPQLLSWLKSLSVTVGYENKHYPVHLLKELLDAPGDQKVLSPGLLKPLNKLQECVARASDTYVKSNWLRLSTLSLPNQYSALIARLMLRSPALTQLATKIQQAFEKKDQSPELLEALYQWLALPTVLDGRFATADVEKWFDYLVALAASGVDPSLHKETKLRLLRHLHQQALPKRDLSNAIDAGWTVPAAQIERLWNAVRPAGRGFSNWFGLTGQGDEQLKAIILAYATHGQFDFTEDLPKLWQKLDSYALAELVKYYQMGAHLSLTRLTSLLSEKESYNKEAIKERLHHYETVVQGLLPNGNDKRVFSAPDLSELLRVISGFEKKGVGPCPLEEQEHLVNLFYYMNEFSQTQQLHDISFTELQAQLNLARADLLAQPDQTSMAARQASARLLGCMREIMVRRNGKWANHTQMMALLYAACHNDEGLIHQVKTGQGKSILSLMRASYLALTGDVVDVFSAKESLSSRDYIEALPILNAFGIPCSYITPASPMSDYKQRSGGGFFSGPVMGAVNFATIGNFSLFLSRNAWMDADKLLFDKDHRVAFLDEADHILLDDQTQFNLPDPGDVKDAYNFDEWVYRIINNYYKEELVNDETFSTTRAVSRKKHLDKLTQFILDERTKAPEDSKFIGLHLLPSLANKGVVSEEALKKRDEALIYLLKATHAAHQLKEGVDFCVSYDKRQLQNQIVSVRILNVMINNQVQEGATYSDAVQQMLCVRKNEEAAAKGEQPNYFVDPESKIVLSQNCRSVIANHYRKIEGCTGTAGNAQELDVYEQSYGLNHVVKLPTHEPMKTQFKATTYAPNFASQVDAIVKSIEEHSAKQPMLVTCKDDIEVKRIFAAVEKRLKAKGLAVKLIRDTNDSGKTEAEIVPEAGNLATVTFSSRMGRGTDIKPQSVLGLYLLRTYLASARVTKQEIGRTGRNGACGVCESCINLEELLHEYALYDSHPKGKEQLKRLMAYEATHLDLKIAKHQKKGSSKLDWLSGDDKGLIKEHYLKARVCIQFRNQMHQQQNAKLRRQEALTAAMTTAVENCLRSDFAKKSANQTFVKEFKIAWTACRTALDSAWHKYLADQKNESEAKSQQRWNEFLATTIAGWRPLLSLAQKTASTELIQWAGSNSEEQLKSVHQDAFMHIGEEELKERGAKIKNADPHLLQFIDFHQKWMERAVECRNDSLSNAKKESKAQLNKEFDGDKLIGFNTLFAQFNQLKAVYLRREKAEKIEELSVLFDAVHDSLYKALNANLLFMIPNDRAARVLFQWLDKAKQTFASVPKSPTGLETEHALLPLNALFNVLGADKGTHPSGLPDWLPQKQRELFAEQDPTRYANVLEFLTEISFTVGATNWITANNASDKRLEQCLGHVAQVLMEHSWDKLAVTQLFDTLRPFFVLQGHKEHQDHVMEAFAKAFPTYESVHTLLNLMQKQNALTVQGKHFIAYISSNAALLRQDDLCQVLPIVAELTLGESGSELNELPAADAFMKATLADDKTVFCKQFAQLEDKTSFNQRFWLFLAQRRPLKVQEIEHFHSLLQQHADLDKANLVLSLPPYLTIGRINTTLLAKPMDKGSFIKQCREMHQAADEFNRWLAQEGIIVSANSYKHYNKNATRWVDLFNQLPPASSIELFSLLRKNKVPATISDRLFVQLSQLMSQATLPLGSAWDHYTQELSLLLTLPKAWREALEPSLLECDEEPAKMRLTFFTALHRQLHQSDSLNAAWKEFPLLCYKAYRKGRLDCLDSSFEELIDLYHKAGSAHTSSVCSAVINKALQECLTFDLDKQQLSNGIGQTYRWIESYLALPNEWHQALDFSIAQANLLDKSVLNHWPNFFAALVECIPKREIPNLSSLAPLLLQQWIADHAVDNQTKTKAMTAVLRLASTVDPLEWNSLIVDGFWAQPEVPLTTRLELLLAREALVKTFAIIPPQFSTILERETQAILLGQEIQKINQYQRFLTLLYSELPDNLSNSSELSDMVLMALSQNVMQLNNEQQIKESIKHSLEVLMKISEYSGTSKEAFFIKQYHRALKDNQLAMLSEFLDQMPKDLPEESYSALWQGFSQGILLAYDYNSPQSLAKAVFVTQRALAARDKQRLAEWFVDPQDQQKRIELMRGLHFGYVSLDKKTNKSCWVHFTDMVRNLISNLPKLFGVRYHQVTVDGLGRLTNMLHEMRSIVSMPGTPLTASHMTKGKTSASSLSSQYNKEFKDLKDSYDAAWWKNTDRRKQAKQLFSVMSLNSDSNKEDYYLAVINQIVAVQKEIIASDAKALGARNTKGYSRLHDISNKMLVSVACGYLAEEDEEMQSREGRTSQIKQVLEDLLQSHKQVFTKRGGLFEPAVKLPQELQYLHDTINSLESAATKPQVR